MPTSDPIQPLVDEIIRRLNLDGLGSFKDELNQIINKRSREADKVYAEMQEQIRKALDSLSSQQKEIVITDKRGPTPEITNIGKQHKQFALLLSYVNINLTPYVHGPTGSGKTQAAFKVAEALKTPAYRIALCSQTSKSEILGYNDAHGKYCAGIAFEPYINGGILIVDELDNGNPNVNSVLNMLTDGNDCMFPCGRRPRHKNFKVITTANTIGNGATRRYVGRSPQDKALLNRLVNIYWDYDQAFEKDLAWVEWLSYGGAQTEEAKKTFNKRLDDFWCMRRAADELALDHILSTRNLLQEIRMFASGIDLVEIGRSVICRGLDKDQWIKLKDKANEYSKKSNVHDVKEETAIEMEVVDDDDFGLPKKLRGNR